MDAATIKEFALRAGADACGVAGIGRFDEAPQGFNPRDVFSKCQSVIVFIKQMPVGAILAENPVPYTHAAQKMYEDLDGIAINLCLFLQKKRINAVMIPADVPYLYWDQENLHGRGIISLKHAAVLAGLGMMGKSTIFINEALGNIVYIGAVLTDAALDADPLVEGFKCPPACQKCLDACAQHAIEGQNVNQKLCRAKSVMQTARGWSIYTCSECRKACPYLAGRQKRWCEAVNGRGGVLNSEQTLTNACGMNYRIYLAYCDGRKKRRLQQPGQLPGVGNLRYGSANPKPTPGGVCLGLILG